jgi:hypothetical protein
MDVHIHASSHECVFATWQRIVLAVWRGNTTVAAVRLGDQVLAQHAEERGERVFLLTVVEENCPLPPVEARVELAACLRRASAVVARSAVVFEGEGFRASSVRAVVAGISLFSRPEYPHRVFASVSSAARFLASGLGVASPGAHHLIGMVNGARRAQGTQTFVPLLAGAP